MYFSFFVSICYFFYIFFFNLGSKNSGKAERSQRLPVLRFCKHDPSWGSWHLSRKVFVFWGGSVGRLHMAHSSLRDVKQQTNKPKAACTEECWLHNLHDIWVAFSLRPIGTAVYTIDHIPIDLWGTGEGRDRGGWWCGGEREVNRRTVERMEGVSGGELRGKETDWSGA